MAQIAPGDVLGFVGLGNMGDPMVARLLGGGFRVQGFDPNPAAGADLEGRDGYTRVASLEEAARGARAVILMLPNSQIVRSVLVEGSLFEVMQPGTMVIDMSSSRPSETVSLTEEALSRGLRMIDAPVSGGVPSAREGTLTVMAGGPVEWVEEFRPALERIGHHLEHAGDAGAGHALKAINNLLSASSLIASSEALVIGTKFGLDPKVMMDVINGSSGKSWSTLTKWPRYILPRTFDSHFLMSLLIKDTTIAVDLAHQSGLAVPHAEATLRMWESALEELPFEAPDHTDMHRWVEAKTGFETPKVTDTD